MRPGGFILALFGVFWPFLCTPLDRKIYGRSGGRDVSRGEGPDLNRKDYDALLELPLSGWGWEYARRFPELKKAAARARRTAPVMIERRDGVRLIRLRRRYPEAEEFGLQFFPDPEKSALETTPFWLPEAANSSLEAALEFEEMHARKGRTLSWTALPGEKHFLIGPGRRPKLVVAAKGYAAQIAIEENMLPVPQAVYLSLRLGAGQLVGEHLRAVEEFAAFCHGAKGRCRMLRGLSPERLRDAIIALDGELAGFPRRKIGEAIFGAEAVARGWDVGDESYKKRTKRLVEKGLALMEFGYRKLL